MSEPIQRRRVLLAAADQERAPLRALFATKPLRDWDVMEADTPERARFLLQLDACDVLLLDSGLTRHDTGDDGAWLTGQRQTPVLLLAEDDPGTAGYWLPREVARRHAGVLAVMLGQAAEFGALQRRGRGDRDALGDARRQVSRLAHLLWEAVPGPGRARWFTQRLMLERLEEEVIRAQRYGGPLSVVLGEVEGPERASALPVDQISRVKRRSDVAGQYGLQGFMIILPQTGAAGAAGCCRRLHNILARPTDGGPCSRVHFGVASFAAEAHSVKSLLGRAEECLERARLGPPEVAPA